MNISTTATARTPRTLVSSLTFQIIVAMVLGLVAGGIWGKEVSIFGEFAKVLIQFIRALATPLLFFAIVDAFLRTELKWSHASKLIFVTTINAALAIALALTLTHFIPTAETLGPLLKAAQEGALVPDELKNPGAQLSGIAFLKTLLPASLLKPFVENETLTVAAMAVFFGAAAAQVAEPHRALVRERVAPVVHFAFALVEKALSWAIRLSPIAVFGAVAKAFGAQGWAALQGLAVYLAVPTLGLTLMVVGVYSLWIRFVGKIPLLQFWREAANACVYAFGTNSSLATLPLTLQALDRLKISPEAARMGACVGTNFNNDGILLYQATALLMVAAGLGVHFTFPQMLAACGVCLATTLGVTGVPESGVIALSLVFASFGLPVEILGILLGVDWFLARLRSVTNVVADMTVSIALDRLGRSRL